MSGMLYIMPTEFYDLTTKTKTLGFRIFDDISHAYDNRWVDMPMDGPAILTRILESEDYQVLEFFDEVLENKSPIIIGGKLYKYKEIESILNSWCGDKAYDEDLDQ